MLTYILCICIYYSLEKTCKIKQNCSMLIDYAMLERGTSLPIRFIIIEHLFLVHMEMNNICHFYVIFKVYRACLIECAEKNIGKRRQ